MIEQYTLFADNAEYDAFTAKFEPKKTTDDCYTPPEVYAVIRDWACQRWDIDPASIVRPFYPGGDYESFGYPDGCTVLDNPPFSILSKICTFYLDRGVPFFLFAPSLTCFDAGRNNVMRMNHVICDCNIAYENGAVVRTSFVTSYGGDIVAQTAPDLTKQVNAVCDRLRHRQTWELPKYSYPDHIVTAALLQRYSKYGVEWAIHRDDCTPIHAMDAQRPEKKRIYGSGLLLSERAAVERAAADRAAAERATAERAAATKWPLSEREKAIVRTLGKK